MMWSLCSWNIVKTRVAQDAHQSATEIQNINTNDWKYKWGRLENAFSHAYEMEATKVITGEGSFDRRTEL
jgi:hypothetical protein